MYTTPYTGNEERIAGLVGSYVACVAVVALVMVAFYIFLFWRILTKAGYSGWLALLNLVGGIGTLVLLGILAFGDWPALKRGEYRPAAMPPTYPSGTQPGYQPTQPTYVPPAVPGPPTYTPPTQQPPRAYEPPAPEMPEPPAPPASEPPAGPPLAPPE